MKKLSLLLSTLCLVLMVSCGGGNQKETSSVDTCCNKNKKECAYADKDKCCKGEMQPQCNLNEEQKAECKAFIEKWDNFENLAIEEQTELIAKKKSFFNEKKAKIREQLAECDKAWEGFENLTIAEQKAFLDNVPCDKKGKCCDKDWKNCPRNKK